ncbi:hypothetical protein [Erythrobacter sp. HL-111]|uniref:hypothetical protein n=1 Tax=Erythrobacter sp. HL-111 TaxID=1798193 RepID=UPI0006DBD1CE|nr:hypothetical protein [Erythrobacter sp. HL-111]KPP89449.1 MAG: hypothetical protein HLUCCO15_10240 [Erythrobacteraceae bacterium HL-111]
MSGFTIAPDDLTSADVLDLLRLHLAEMHSWSPACKTEPFRPALRLYESHGFVESAGFGPYLPDEFSLCMERRL